MREIKFRAWDKRKQKMWAVHTWSIPTLITLEWTEENYKKTDKCPQTETDDWQDKYILMQYTGLKDKNGKEIYEGDIVKFIYNSTPQQEIIGQVKWRDDYLAWEFGSYLIEPTPKKTIEIIGNIYENPELLNKTV